MKIENLFEYNIVHTNDDYVIKIDDVEDPRYVSLYFKNNKVGEMNTRILTNHKKYLSPNDIHIDKNHRGNGFGYLMIKLLLDNLSEKFEGLIIHLPEVINKKEIPAIFKKLNAQYLDDDHLIISK